MRGGYLTKPAPITAISVILKLTTLMTGTVKTVAELDMKLLCMEQRWTQTMVQAT